MSRKLRKIEAIPLPSVQINPPIGEMPRLILVAPTDLYVEPDYQRDLSAKSITLIRRIAADWNWAHTKPPICVKDGEKFMVIDGQHTAIAAASRKDIKKLPIMLIDDCKLKDRANAFVAHNTMRVAVTPQQIYFSKLASGDQMASIVEDACKRAGAKVLAYPPANGLFNVGETMAVSSLYRIAENKGVAGLTRILKILVKAKRQIKSTEMAALYMLLYGKTSEPLEDEDLISAIGLKSVRGWESSVASYRDKNRASLSSALALYWTKEIKKGANER